MSRTMNAEPDFDEAVWAEKKSRKKAAKAEEAKEEVTSLKKVKKGYSLCYSCDDTYLSSFEKCPACFPFPGYESKPKEEKRKSKHKPAIVKRINVLEDDEVPVVEKPLVKKRKAKEIKERPVVQSSWLIQLGTNIPFPKEEVEERKVYKELWEQCIKEFFNDKESVLGVLSFDNKFGPVPKDYLSLDIYTKAEFKPTPPFNLHAHGMLNIIHRSNIKLNSRYIQARLKKCFNSMVEQRGLDHRIKKCIFHFNLIPAGEAGWDSKAFNREKIKAYIDKNAREFEDVDHLVDIVEEMTKEMDSKTDIVPKEDDGYGKVIDHNGVELRRIGLPPKKRVKELIKTNPPIVVYEDGEEELCDDCLKNPVYEPRTPEYSPTEPLKEDKGDASSDESDSDDEEDKRKVLKMAKDYVHKTYLGKSSDSDDSDKENIPPSQNNSRTSKVPVVQFRLPKYQ